jgi:hypothetical protein
MSADFIPAAYVKFFESCGTRVVPLDWRLPANETRAQMNELNGVAIVGRGNINLVNEDGTFAHFTRQAFNVLDYAKALNTMHYYFPVFGFSTGSLVIHLHETKDSSILSASTAQKVAEVVNFYTTGSKIFNLSAENNINDYQTDSVGWNDRTQCITVEKFAEMYAADPSKYMVVTTSTADAEGQTCVSISESRDYPFYTVSYAIEAAMYDFSDSAIPHNAKIRQFSEDIQFFFARETRNSIHYFNSYIHVVYEYIWHNKHTFSLSNSISDMYTLHVIDPISSLISK